MKHKLFIISIIILALFSLSSCERQSGRKSDSRGNRQNTSPSTPSSKRIQQPQTNMPIQNSRSNSQTSNTIMTGTDIFEKYCSAVFMVFTSDGLSNYQGSGFFISATGIAVSNYHVFKGTAIGSEQLRLSNGSTYKLKNIIAKNEDKDIIIFEVESNGHSFNYIPISHRQPKVGEKAYAIGSPRGLENTFSSGEISQFRGDFLIQISVPIDHGSSGGALLNAYGEVIGITTAGLDDSGANLNFAVNIKVLQKYLK